VLTIPDRGSSHWNSNLQFQPVTPIALTPNWNLITRPVIPLFTSVPYFQQEPNSSSSEELRRSTAFGDTILMEQISPSPKVTGNWLFGVGPTFVFPTASDVQNGQGKWQAGPSAILGYFSKKWVLAAFLQDWISFAGQNNRDSVHQMNLQPIASYFLPKVGLSVILETSYNWRARNSATLDCSLGIMSQGGEIRKLPVKIYVAGRCAFIRNFRK
jgi:hypothetical protein